MTHIMLDLETISTQPNARIIAIGAVKFLPEMGVYDKYYQAVTAPILEPLMQSHIDEQGFHVSNDTLHWWSNQIDEAKAVFSDPNAIDIDEALASFASWALIEDTIDIVRMWGNGASFDNVILAEAYRLRNMQQPWKFWNDRCYRTVRHMHPNVLMERIGVHHNATDDAETQAMHLLKMGLILA